MSETGMKFDDMKLDWSLLPIDAIEEEIKVLMIGAEKYEANNWMKVKDPIKRYINGAYRHLGDVVKYINNGMPDEEISKLKDVDTGIHPFAHAACDIHFALYLLKHFGHFDDCSWKESIKSIREKYKKERGENK